MLRDRVWFEFRYAWKRDAIRWTDAVARFAKTSRVILLIFSVVSDHVFCVNALQIARTLFSPLEARNYSKAAVYVDFLVKRRSMNREFAKEGQNSRGTHIDETYATRARAQHRYAFAISARERNKRVETVVKRSPKKKEKYRWPAFSVINHRPGIRRGKNNRQDR